MKIWTKSLISLGIVGTAVSATAIGISQSYKNYESKTHKGRGNFSTKIPNELINSNMYY